MLPVQHVMYSRFCDDIICHIMVHMARGVGNNDVGVVLKQAVKISNKFARERHTDGLCRRIQ